jgi:hypothetical protein
LSLGGICVLALVSSVSANAQSSGARATVPFEFAAGGAMLPPGEYTIDISDLSGVIVLHGLSKNGSVATSVALLSTFSGATSPSASAKLIFERRAGMACLSAVEWPDQSARVTDAFKHTAKGAVAAAIR